jgi:hypothetical protein
MTDAFSIVALPFLKTSAPVRLGKLTFRSTEDLKGLAEDHAAAVAEVSRMLFAQDDFRIKAACYSLIPAIDLDRAPHDTAHLEHIWSVVAYLYSSPHDVFGTSFLHTEHASVVIFTPATLSPYLIRPSYNVVNEGAGPPSDSESHVRGYAGLHNFHDHFWAVPGSRVYGPLQHPVLNISQDLAQDVEQAKEHNTYRSLFRLLDAAPSPSYARILTALRWYASANHRASDDYSAIVQLSIAFEALLGLPQSEKTDRLVDAISLLLGRTPRLDLWARQFYDARSHIVHEGRATDLRFAVTPNAGERERQLYQSLFSYGSQVFRMCLGTLLVGIDLAERAGLADKFVTNQERYVELCRLFDDTRVDTQARFRKAAELVATIERYRFVGETGLQIDTMIGAVRGAAKKNKDSGEHIAAEESTALVGIVEANRSPDRFEQLEAIRLLDQTYPDAQPPDADASDVVRRLIKAVWGSVFLHYYWLKKQKDK